MRSLPVLTVKAAPFPLEAFGIAAADPELRLLQVDGLRPGVQGTLHTPAQELSVIGARAHIVNVASVVDPVEPAVQVILVMAPGNAAHHVDPIAVLAPGLDPLGQFRIDAIDNCHIRTQVPVSTPALSGLKTGAFQDRIFERWNRRWR